MGSLQQTVLGVICITAAFFFGQYMRTHPSPDALALQAEHQAVGNSATPSPFGKSFGSAASSGAATDAGLPAPSAGFGNVAESTHSATPSTQRTALPETMPQPPSKTFTEMVTRVPKKQFASPAAAGQIDIPDFSELAASFENTPLALSQRNPIQRDRFEQRQPSPTLQTDPRVNTRLVDRTATPHSQFHSSTADLSRNDFASSRRQPDIRPTTAELPTTVGSSRTWSHGAFAGSRAERVSPPEPMEPYELKQHASGFRQQDFAPQLGRQTAAPATQPADTDIRPTRLSLAPPDIESTMLAPEVPDLEIVIPQPTSRTNSTVNDKHVHSYYDTLSTNNGFTRGDFQAASSQERTSRRADRETQFQPTTMERAEPADAGDQMLKSENVLVAKPPTSSSKSQRRRSIPFGFNEAGRNELARVRSRQQSNIDLPTDRFSQHTTQTGDTLQSLSVEYYGKPDFYLDIYLANQSVLRNPVQIPAGIQLQIPVYE